MGSSGLEKKLKAIDVNVHGWKSDAARIIFEDDPQLPIVEIQRAIEKHFPGTSVSGPTIREAIKNPQKKLEETQEFGNGDTPEFHELLVVPGKREEQAIVLSTSIAPGALEGVRLVADVSRWLRKTDIRASEILDLLRVCPDGTLLREVLTVLGEEEGK
jgi:hypothetical protein